MERELTLQICLYKDFPHPKAGAERPDVRAVPLFSSKAAC